MAYAGSAGPGQNQESGIFVGLGGSYNSVKFDQDYSANGVGDVYSGGVKVATGHAGGPGAPFSDNQNTFAPEFQAGYYRFFKGTYNFWGIKFLYQYFNTTSIDKLIDTPQAGFLDPVNNAEEMFTGNVITKSAQTDINHEMMLLVFLGQRIDNVNLFRRWSCHLRNKIEY